MNSTVRIQVRVVVPAFQLWDHPSSLLASTSGNVLLPSSVCDNGSFQGGVCCNCFSFSISALLPQVAYKNLQHSHIAHVQSSLENTTLLWLLPKQPLGEVTGVCCDFSSNQAGLEEVRVSSDSMHPSIFACCAHWLQAGRDHHLLQFYRALAYQCFQSQHW